MRVREEGAEVISPNLGFCGALSDKNHTARLIVLMCSIPPAMRLLIALAYVACARADSHSSAGSGCVDPTLETVNGNFVLKSGADVHVQFCEAAKGGVQESTISLKV